VNLPSAVRVIEVGPRDGYQMERMQISTEAKVETIERLIGAGLREIEMVSFVHPRVIPQMVDAGEVMARVPVTEGVRRSCLVPNLKGAERAIAAKVDEVRLVICATESYNQKNVGMSIAESLDDFAEIADLANRNDVLVSAAIGVSLGCPLEGIPPASRVASIARGLKERGGWSAGIADSYGMSNPAAVRTALRTIQDEVGGFPLWMHLHDTRGLGIANAVASMQEGVSAFDTAFGGLGGTPVMKGASGNLPTEDFVFLCHEMGIETGVDLDRLRETSRWVGEMLGRKLPSHVLEAGTLEELIELNRG